MLHPYLNSPEAALRGPVISVRCWSCVIITFIACLPFRTGSGALTIHFNPPSSRWHWE